MITRLFLRGKAWQIFLAYIIVFFILILLYFVFSKLIPAKTQDLLRVLTTVFPLFSLLWLYILGVNLHSKLPEPSSMNIMLFKLNLFFTFLCFLSFQYLYMEHESFYFIYLNFSFIYMMYFLSKSLVSVEKGKLIGFYDYIGVFFYIWVWPLGIWWLQPRIRNIFSESDNA